MRNGHGRSSDGRRVGVPETPRDGTGDGTAATGLRPYASMKIGFPALAMACYGTTRGNVNSTLTSSLLVGFASYVQFWEHRRG
jgi:hypothetical protein